MSDELVKIAPNGQWTLEKGFSIRNGLIGTAALWGTLGAAGAAGNAALDHSTPPAHVQTTKKVVDRSKVGVPQAASAGAAASNVKKEEGETHDHKGRCNSCGSKACDGADCKVDHEKAAVDANNEKNKGFRNGIKISGNGQWNLKKD